MTGVKGERQTRKVWRSTAAAVIALALVSPASWMAGYPVYAESPAAERSPATNVQTDQAALLNAALPPELAEVQLISEQPVTAGAVLKTYRWTFQRGASVAEVIVNVIEVDLHNPLVKLDTIAGTGGQFTKKQSVRRMANETGAAAAINGDFFNMSAEGVPIGAQISDGKLLASAPFLPGLYSFGITKDNKPVVASFAFEGRITAKNGAVYPLGGINKTYYWYENDGIHPEGQHSMIDGLYMYTNAWGQVDRSNDGVTVPTEVLVQNGIIKQIALNGIIDMIAPPDGYILRASGKAAEFVQQNLKVGDPLFAQYTMYSQDPLQPYEADSFKMMISGQTILVDNGKPTAFTRPTTGLNGNRARTAIGHSQDGRYAYLVTADHVGEKDGLTLQELQHLLIKLGVWKGINLDGGGSTQMAVRPLGSFETELANVLENNSSYERPVVNSVGVFSLAPKGQLKEFSIDGPSALFLKEKAEYRIAGAYDEYYNPVKPEEIPAVWSSTNPVGTFDGNTFTATASGKTTISVNTGALSRKKEVEVVNGKQIASMRIEASPTALSANTVYRLTAIATTKSGITRIVPPEALQWELIGFKGHVEGDTLTVESIDPDATEGRAIARYDGFSAMVTLPITEEKIVESFETRTPISFTVQNGAKGSVYKMKNVPGLDPNNTVLVLEYDFRNGEKTTVSSALFMDGGLPIEGEPTAMSVKVKGDKSMNWIRAEVADSTGKKHLIGLTEKTDWEDWKTLSADLTKYDLNYPIALTRLYVANPENGHDQRALEGTVMFDDITFQFKRTVTKPKNKVELAINQKKVLVNGQEMMLDQAPILHQDNTMVPIRFVIEALGGQLTWVDSERKVVIIKDEHLLELWLDQHELIADGTAVTAEVPPILAGERTMVPLRIISEQLGFKVTWDPVAYSITLE